MPELLEPDSRVEIGRCIYCPRERTTWDLPLGDEHVIPLGMGGEWLLLNASCKDHEKVTGRFEGLVMNRGGLKDLREVMGFPSRRAKKRTGKRDVTFQVGGEHRTEHVPVDQHPGGWVLPVYAPPTKLTGEEPADEFRVLHRVGKQRHDAARKLGEQFGATGHQVSVVDPRAWAQMMAKIGYCFAVGCVGFDTFEEVYVLPTILEGGKLAGHYVGCVEGPPVNAETQGHAVTMTQTQRELTVYIRLVGQQEFPEYTVVVGRLRDTEYVVRERGLPA